MRLFRRITARARLVFLDLDAFVEVGAEKRFGAQASDRGARTSWVLRVVATRGWVGLGVLQLIGGVTAEIVALTNSDTFAFGDIDLFGYVILARRRGFTPLDVTSIVVETRSG